VLAGRGPILSVLTLQKVPCTRFAVEKERRGEGRPPAAAAQIREEGLTGGLLSSLATADASLTGRHGVWRHHPGSYSEGDGVK
jgi:hypothetical protein